MTTTYVDYIGRLHDVMALTVPAEGTGSVELAFNKGGEITTGVQKLAQRFFMLLFTPRGSVPYAADVGSDFLLALANGGLRSVADVYTAFSAALVDVREQLLAQETTSDPNDERFDEAEIVNLRIDTATVYITVRLITVAGAEARYIAPIPTTV